MLITMMSQSSYFYFVFVVDVIVVVDIIVVINMAVVVVHVDLLAVAVAVLIIVANHILFSCASMLSTNLYLSLLKANVKFVCGGWDGVVCKLIFLLTPTAVKIDVLLRFSLGSDNSPVSVSFK